MKAAVRALFVLALIATGCGGDGAAGGEVVEIFGPYQGRQADLFTADLQAWAATEGIAIRYTGTGNFADDLERQVYGLSDPPDIAVVPQRGVVERLAADGRIRAMPVEVVAAAGERLAPGAVQLAEVDGELVGVPVQVNVKSLVWYRPSIFAALGLGVPDTLDELEALVAAAAAEGISPWCLAIEAQTATGWPATDWIEDLVVRRSGPATYEQWVRGDVAFADDRIAAAFDEFATLVADRRVAGGITAALSTSTQDGDDPLFTDPPGCVLYKQASFARGWMPDGLQFGPDGDLDAFVLPGVDADELPPLVVGADLAVAFDQGDAVDAVLEFLTTADAGRSWAAAGGYVNPRTDVDPDTYFQPSDRFAAERLLSHPTLVYDASDAMAPEIGAGLFWEEITRWLSGAVPVDELAATLDAARGGG